jgi:hypothetical protein
MVVNFIGVNLLMEPINDIIGSRYQANDKHRKHTKEVEASKCNLKDLGLKPI